MAPSLKRPLIVLLSFCLLFIPAFAASLAESDVLAIVGSQEITGNYYQTAFSRAVRAGGPNTGQTEDKRAFLDFLIDTKLFAMEAKAEKIHTDPVVQARVEALVDHIYASEWITRQIPKDIVVSEADARAYYRKNPEDFTRPEQLLLRQIVTGTEEEAVRILSQLKEGEDFSHLARSTSIDPTAKSGGLVGWLRQGRLPENVMKAAQGLGMGEIAGPIATAIGFHIIKLENRKEARLHSFEEIQAAATAKARMARQKAQWNQIRSRLRKKYKVEINTELVGDRLSR